MSNPHVTRAWSTGSAPRCRRTTSTPNSSTSRAPRWPMRAASHCSIAWPTSPTSSIATRSSRRDRSRAITFSTATPLLPARRLPHHRRPDGAVSRVGSARSALQAIAALGHRGGSRRDHPSDRGKLHRLHRARARFRHHAARPGLAPSVERTIVGFMGCFAAVNALKLARHIVRSEPRRQGAGGQSGTLQPASAGTVGTREDAELPAVRRRLRRLPGIGRTASALRSTAFHADVIPRTADLITWHIGDQGFRDASVRPGAGPHPPLAGEHGRRTARQSHRARRSRCGRCMPAAARSSTPCSTAWRCRPDALRYSRDVLRDFGNMSSATLVFVLDRILRASRCHRRRHGDGVRAGPDASKPSRSIDHEPRRAQHRRERMDTDCVDYDDYRRCLRDLSRVNTVTLTHRPMLAWLARETARGAVVLAARCRLRPWRRAAPHPPLGHATRTRGASFTASISIRGRRGRRATRHRAERAHRPIAPATCSPSTPARAFDFIVSSQFTHHLTDDAGGDVHPLDGGACAARLVHRRPAPPLAALLRLRPARVARALASLRAERRPHLDRARLRPGRLAPADARGRVPTETRRRRSPGICRSGSASRDIVRTR